MAMNCPACNADLTENAVYCPQCGERIDDLNSQESSEQPADRPAESPKPSETYDPPPADLERPRVAAGADRFKNSLQSRDKGMEDDSEDELWEGSYCGKAMAGTWLLSLFISVVLLVIGVLWASSTYVWIGLGVVVLVTWGYPLMLYLYRRVSVRYRLTSQRFFHEEGILRHVTDRIEVIDMDDITFDQTILERLFNVGTIHVTSSDRTHPVLDVKGIKDVKRVASLMDDARRTERMRRGIHIESV